MLKIVIVDDEAKAIQSLSWELSNFKKDISIVSSFTSPEDALYFLANNNIDCLFLDIEMPTIDGFQFLKKLKKRDFAVVITTAYNEYAIKALKNEAIDYLLKPIDTDDLEETIVKIKKHKNIHKSPKNIERVLTSLKHKKITINTDGKLIFLDPDEILFVESDGNYSTINVTSKKIVLTKNLKEVNKLLSPEEFFRIHNSYIINLSKIKEFIKADGYVIIEGNHKIPVSRQRKSEFLNKF